MIRNFILPTKEEEIRKVIERCRSDFYFFNYVNSKIKGKIGGIQSLKHTSIQKKFGDLFLTTWHDKLPVRIASLKARQVGITTITEELFYWILMFHKNYHAIIMAQDVGTAKEIYQIFQTFYNNSLPYFQPTILSKNQRSMHFGIQQENGIGGLNSKISTLTAKSSESGRGYTAQLVHLSELASWEYGEEIDGGLKQSVANEPYTAMVYESTAKRMHDYWHSVWDSANKPESSVQPIFFPWTDHVKYRSKPKSSLLTLEEGKLMEKGLDLEQIAFRRYKIYDDFLGNVDRFKSEYPLTAEEAFSFTGSNVFPAVDIKRMMQAAKQAPVKTYELSYTDHKGNVDNSRVVSIEARTTLKVWDKPQVGVKYYISGDVASGSLKGDFSVASVMYDDNGITKVAARLRDKMPPEVFGDELIKLGLWYNTALIAPESNNHGLTTINQIKNRNYPNMYKSIKTYKQDYELASTDFGWDTNRETKLLSTNRLIDRIRKRKFIDLDEEFCKEMGYYYEDEKGSRNARSGKHDDIIMSNAIGVMMFDNTPRRQNAKAYTSINRFKNGVIGDPVGRRRTQQTEVLIDNKMYT